MDAIYLAIDGQQKGPFTQAQVKDMLAKGEATAETLAWHEGLADWSPVSKLIGATAAPATPAPSAPSAAAAAVVASVNAPAGAFSQPELAEISKWLRFLLWSFIAGMVSGLILSHIPMIGLLFSLVSLAAWIADIYIVFMLATALRQQMPWLWAVGVVVPCVNLVVIIIAAVKGFQALQAGNYPFDFMGKK